VLLSFQYSTSRPIAGVGDRYVRFYRNDGAAARKQQKHLGCDASHPVVLTITGHGYANGDDIEVTASLG